jgi:hypothetical protein
VSSYTSVAVAARVCKITVGNVHAVSQVRAGHALTAISQHTTVHVGAARAMPGVGRATDVHRVVRTMSSRGAWHGHAAGRVRRLAGLTLPVVATYEAAGLVAAFVDAAALCGARWIIGVRDAGAIEPGRGRCGGGCKIAAVVLGARGRAGLVTTVKFA